MTEDDTGAAMEMPRYVSHKKVWALEIESVSVGAPYRMKPADKGYAEIALPAEMWARYQPVSGDFYVVYADGYKSFSPRKSFLEGYTSEPPETYRDRVVQEESALSERLIKLGEFIHGSSFGALHPEDRRLLQEQDDHMRAYVKVLRERISRFTAAK